MAGSIRRATWIVSAVVSLILRLGVVNAAEAFDVQKFMSGSGLKSIVHLTVNGITAGGEGGSSSGTAFFISDTGFALTAAHLFYKERNLKGQPLITAAVGKRYIEGRIGGPNADPKEFDYIKVYPEEDVALIRLRGAPGSFEALKICSRTPSFTDDLHAFGFELGLVLAHEDGRMKSELINDRRPVSIAINEGMSGGPVITPSGRVFAVALSGVRELNVELFNFVREIQFLPLVLKEAQVNEDCGDAPSPIPNINEALGPDEHLQIYVGFSPPGSNSILQGYRESLLAQFHELSARIKIYRSFEPTYKSGWLDQVFNEEFVGRADKTVLEALALSERRNSRDNSKRQFVYLVKLQDDRNPQNNEILIRAIPRLLEFECKDSTATLVRDISLSARPEAFKDFETTAQKQAIKLLLDLAQLDTNRFSRPVVFVDCVDARFLATDLIWRLAGPFALMQKLAKKWTEPAQERFHDLKLVPADSETCKSEWKGETDRYAYSFLAKETITPIVIKSTEGGNIAYRASWEKHEIGGQPREYPPKGSSTALANVDPFLQMWVDYITCAWWDGNAAACDENGSDR